MKKYPFSSITELDHLIKTYFGKLDDEADAKKTKKEIAPPTMSGLAYHLGFESVQAFESCEAKGKYASPLKRARLRVEAEYEKKLHFQSSTGAIFALKSMGWDARSKNNTSDEPTDSILKVEVINVGPNLAGSERDVIM
jgi:hypothetical protein